MRSLSSLRIVRVTLALTVAFWMAGAGCLIGCDNMMSAAAADDHGVLIAGSEAPASSPTVVVAGDACASMHSRDCCAKHKTKAASKSVVESESKSKLDSRKPALATAGSNVPELGGTSSPMMDCPLAVNASAALSKATPDTSSTVVPLTRAYASLLPQPEHALALSPPLRLPNRGHTYLRCCVFLI